MLPGPVTLHDTDPVVICSPAHSVPAALWQKVRHLACAALVGFGLPVAVAR